MLVFLFLPSMIILYAVSVVLFDLVSFWLILAVTAISQEG